MADMEMNKKQELMAKFIEKVIKEALQKQMEQIENKFLDLIAKMNIKNKRLGDKITFLCEDFTERFEKIDKRIEKVEKIKVDLEEKMQKIQIREKEVEQRLDPEMCMDLIDLGLKKNAIRLRGFPEIEEDLKVVLPQAFAVWTELNPKDVSNQIEDIYRVNSHYAKKKKLPRDIVIHFTNYGLKREILQASYGMEWAYNGETVQVFKEIPQKILFKRKQFSFLVTELKNRNIRYRWEIPTGLFLVYGEQRYHLNTLEKARDFYKNVLMRENFLGIEYERKEDLNQIGKDNLEINQLDIKMEKQETQREESLIKRDENRIVKESHEKSKEVKKFDALKGKEDEESSKLQEIKKDQESKRKGGNGEMSVQPGPGRVGLLPQQDGSARGRLGGKNGKDERIVFKREWVYGI